ncbi:endolysin [Gordonia phage Fairfaxidum]|uniref:Lysin A n=1 Tax=Gordonia phage Fairfaxidum TaxID=2572526 RepID=A0A4D6T7N7_9CAUD|nr:endolysin [Gordonia phage Fairfaxidum]QCG77603.1 lysin A [Gordonia phage Fairfaxidum]
MTTVIDTAAGFPTAQAIKRAGHSGIVAYVSPSRPGTNFAGKPITKAVADEYRRAGIDVAAVWQYGKPGDRTPSDWTTGYEGGKHMARQALSIARAAGMPGWCPIYFAVDEDITLRQWNDTASQFFRGCADEIGREWVGIYGHSRVCGWAIEDGLVDPRWVWVTRAWSNDDGRGYAALYQRVIDTASNPGPRVGGIVVDVNDVYARDWGQWSIDRAPKNTTPAPTTGDSTVVDFGITKRIPAGTDGDRSRDDFVGLHTQEGGTGDAVGLAKFCQGGGVSYNVAVDDIDTVEMVAPGNAPWAAVAANDLGYHICFAGSYVSWSRGRWLSKDASDGLDEDAMLWRGARAAAAACQKFGIPPVWVGNNGTTGWPTGRGICGHKDFGARGGGHTDPYPNFPIDEFIRRVQSFLAPVPNLIDAEAKAAAAWIGKRLTDGEKPITKAGQKVGAFAKFDHGHIYWRSGANRAYAIPHGGIFEAFAVRGFETRELGFPILRHEVFGWGGNQNFEGGVLFVPKGGPTAGYLVHGEIGRRYAAMGWETGPLGLPTSDEEKVAGTDNITQTFQRGRLTWSPTGVVVTLTTTEGV